jgi:hypothetical protein
VRGVRRFGTSRPGLLRNFRKLSEPVRKSSLVNLAEAEFGKLDPATSFPIA